MRYQLYAPMICKRRLIFWRREEPLLKKDIELRRLIYVWGIADRHTRSRANWEWAMSMMTG